MTQLTVTFCDSSCRSVSCQPRNLDKFDFGFSGNNARTHSRSIQRAPIIPNTIIHFYRAASRSLRESGRHYSSCRRFFYLEIRISPNIIIREIMRAQRARQLDFASETEWQVLYTYQKAIIISDIIHLIYFKYTIVIIIPLVKYWSTNFRKYSEQIINLIITEILY